MANLATPPAFSPAAAAGIARELFDIAGTAEALPSERDQNFKYTATANGQRYVLKIANSAETRAVLEAENAAMLHLAASGLTPRVQPTKAGASIGDADGHRVRLISFLNGKPLGTLAHHRSPLLQDLGRVLGTINNQLRTFDHPAVHREFHWDLAHAEDVIERHVPLVRNAGQIHLIKMVLGTYRAQTKPLLAELRKGVIHNDANDYNVLASHDGERIAGIVDFGDMVYSHTVNDLAIAMAYMALGKTDPVAAARDIVRGYHAVNPLTEAEMAVVFNLMCVRLCVSVCLAAKQQAARPDDAYLGISQGPIRETLPKLAAVHARLGHYLIRDACGLEPVPYTRHVLDWLTDQQPNFAALTGHDLRSTPLYGIDLSAGSTLVSSNTPENTAEPFTRRVFERIHEAGAVLGIGGYDEARLIYTTDAFKTGTITDERRTVHVAIDLTLPAGAPLYAPLAGTVHGFEDATDRLDYGPVIVLRHETDAGTPFYTLYGHLNRESLPGLYVGKHIAKGERFAALGAPPINGDWWPHVHFQLITDMLDISANFNGACLASQRNVWRSISPNPNVILQAPESVYVRQRSKPELLAKRAQRSGGNLSVSYGSNPLNIVRGSMQYLYDETGRAFIDAYNNVPHVGHAHPRVVRAVSEQLAVLNTNTRYLQDQLFQYADALTAQLPAELSVCYFVTSGSEANELALRLARAYTGARDLIVMEAAYHGHSSTLIDISPYKHNGPGGTGPPDWVHTSPIPDIYRGAFKANDPQAGLRYAAQVGSVIDGISAANKKLCGYIAETCPSVGGQMLLPPGFLPEVYQRVHAAGGVCIADEVQTGFGRIGTHFWAFEQHGVVPDIVVLGKPIGNGYPLGAVICRPEIAAAFNNGMEFFSTFGGSTAACAAGLATLQVTLDEKLQAHAREVGGYLLENLRALQSKHALIGDVRGAGLFIGIELVRNRETLEPAAAEASLVANRMRERGVLLGTDGPLHNVIKMRGPMPFSRADADIVVAVLDQTLASMP